MDSEFFIYDSPNFKRFLGDNPHENGEVKFLESILEEGMHAIDVGGHMGVTSVVIAKKIGDKGRLYSFEPVPEFFNILKRNLSSNRLRNVKAYQLGVGSHTGRTDFYENATSSSIVPQEGVKKLCVNITTIDTFLNEENVERIDFINMDCQGSEFFVLKGAEGFLRKDNVKIFCEIHHPLLRELGISVQNIIKYLQKLRFQVYSISLDNLAMGYDFDECDYIYAYKQ